ncbi:substrate-binding domain-containing protein [Paenibacillus sp. UNC451MF]|uniref:substrate-binding domain-containing protein n=1 Tax=Paenibacillus sp. UNC451MF TaxID=1449063 RepID=UPI00048B5368|nr:substrate-binding domain-containing protein [Paenibacillus sp. UNC451MF]
MSNRRWSIGLLILSLVFICLLLQFLFSTTRIRELAQPPSVALEPAPRHIVLISQELDNPFWRSVEQGARAAAQQYGWELEYTGSFRINLAEQTKLLEKAIAAKADAILVQGVGNPEYKQWIDKAIAKGIAVLTVDTDEPDSTRLSYIGTDNEEAGQRMGELVVQKTGSAGSIGVLVGSSAESQRLRLEGFQEVIHGYPNLTITEVRTSNISRLQAEQQAADMLAKYPQMQIMVGFSALDGIGIMKAAERANRNDLQIYSFDDLPETIDGIRQGKIVSSIVQQPYKMGYDAVGLLNHYWSGQASEKQHFIPTTVLDPASLGGTAGGASQ